MPPALQMRNLWYCCTADGLAALYRTGFHFFALAYCGSNLREVARLLKVSSRGKGWGLGLGGPVRVWPGGPPAESGIEWGWWSSVE